MSISLIVVSILLSDFRFHVYCDTGYDVSNYFSSYLPREHRNPAIDVIADDLGYPKNENNIIFQGYNNEILPQFLNLKSPLELKSTQSKNYSLVNPHIKGNIPSLDFLSSGLMDYNIRPMSNFRRTKPNYHWLNRSMTWPILWHSQFPRLDLYSKSNSGYNLCNNHVSHMENNSLIDETSNLNENNSINTDNVAKFNSDLLELKELDKRSSVFSDLVGKDFDIDENYKWNSTNKENKFDVTSLKLANHTALDKETFSNIKNLTLNIVKHLPSLTDIYVRKSENDLTKLFNSFNTSSLLNKYEKS